MYILCTYYIYIHIIYNRVQWPIYVLQMYNVYIYVI
jgi:hypothetical protein